jgi:putative transcriptional regulator
MSLAGSFLVAHSSLNDPNFSQTVVLILAHNDSGAFGLVVNRPVKKPELPFPLFCGGPCPAPGLFMLHGHAEWVDFENDEPAVGDADSEQTQREVAPGIFLGDTDSLKRAGHTKNDEAVRFRAYQGYAGWGAGQLEHELNTGSWLVMPAESDILFGTPVEALWRLLAPPRIPQPSAN